VPDTASHDWFTGRAELLVAEHHKRAGANGPALEAYGRALQAFEASARARPDYGPSATWYSALAQAGRARVCLDAGDVAAAAEAIGDAIARMPDVAEQEDGLGRTPLFTLKQVCEQLAAKEMGDARAELERRVTEAAPALWAKVAGG
jgi:hypothetical protein